jgi:cyclopropane fatty-acyl-phospholipid synthase-like methyltransferase
MPAGYSLDYDLRLRRPKYQKQLDRIARYTDGRQLLDIGASSGGFCVIANELGWSARGVELSSRARAIGEGLGAAYVDLDQVSDNSLDVVTCFHVLEHIPDTSSFLKLVGSKLKADGVAVVHVPHQQPLSFAIRNKLSSGDTQCQLYPDGHLTGFTARSLSRAMGLHGFQPLRVTTRSMWSCYHDPFFIKLYLARHDYAGILKHTLRSALDVSGIVVGKGDWVIGHFRKQ